MPIVREELPLTHEQIDQNIDSILKQVGKVPAWGENRAWRKGEHTTLNKIRYINGALRQGMIIAWHASLGYQTLKQIHVQYANDQGNWGYRFWMEVDPPLDYGNGTRTAFTPMANELGDFLQQVNAGQGHRHKFLKGDTSCIYCGRDQEDIEKEGHEHIFLPGKTQCYYCDAVK